MKLRTGINKYHTLPSSLLQNSHRGWGNMGGGMNLMHNQLIYCAQNNQHNVLNNLYDITNGSMNIIMIIMK